MVVPKLLNLGTTPGIIFICIKCELYNMIEDSIYEELCNTLNLTVYYYADLISHLDSLSMKSDNIDVFKEKINSLLYEHENKLSKVNALADKYSSI